LKPTDPAHEPLVEVDPSHAEKVLIPDPRAGLTPAELVRRRLWDVL
jgi:hypothetical protein